MVSFREALDLLLKHTPLLDTESCRIERAANRVLRREIRADRAFPPFDRVMMDGFALRAADIHTSRRFRVTGSAAAGRSAATLSEHANSCIEVMTGATLPFGADCIVPVEETSGYGADEIMVANAFDVVAGRFIHKAGSDAEEGEIWLSPGTRLGCREIGVAASCGAGMLEVSRLPIISVIATGDELVAVDEMPGPHQIRQSNAHAISCTLQQAGFTPADMSMIGDNQSLAIKTLSEKIIACDWLILTGAVSKGAHDFIPAMLDSLGCTRLFHGVAQRPGKPAGCWIGAAGQVIMALPGNPVSALTGLHAFILPALAVASRLAVPKRQRIIPGGAIKGLADMTHHLPVTLGDDGRAYPAPPGNSGDFIGLLRSHGFITLPPHSGNDAAFPFTPWL